jgi:molybdate transport system regulatory protein
MATEAGPTVRIRIVLSAGVAIGPGKADLLAAIETHGSIAAAGRKMKMSYQRAWSLIDELNGMFDEPLVAVSRGGAQRGGATLTAMGQAVLERYRAIETATASICEAELAQIGRMTKGRIRRNERTLASQQKSAEPLAGE